MEKEETQPEQHQPIAEELWNPVNQYQHEFDITEIMSTNSRRERQFRRPMEKEETQPELHQLQ